MLHLGIFVVSSISRPPRPTIQAGIPIVGFLCRRACLRVGLSDSGMILYIEGSPLPALQRVDLALEGSSFTLVTP
jgi:hypothetical protein